jgi:hypothetical protein
MKIRRTRAITGFNNIKKKEEGKDDQEEEEDDQEEEEDGYPVEVEVEVEGVVAHLGSKCLWCPWRWLS